MTTDRYVLGASLGLLGGFVLFAAACGSATNDAEKGRGGASETGGNSGVIATAGLPGGETAGAPAVGNSTGGVSATGGSLMQTGESGSAAAGSEPIGGGGAGADSVAPRFVLLRPEDLPGPTPIGEHVSTVGWFGASADGSVLAGVKRVDDFQGSPNEVRFFWSPDAGLVTVQAPPQAGAFSPTHLSSDGKTVFGGVTETQAVSGGRISYCSSFYRWTEQSGDVPFGPPERMYGGSLYFVNADGTTVVGSVTLSSVAQTPPGEEVRKWFRWQKDRGFEYLSNLEAWPADATPSLLSADGQVIAGLTADTAPFLWRAPNRVVMLNNAPSAFPYCQVENLSNDGSAAFGNCSDSDGLRTAFRWTAETGLSTLGVPGFADATDDGRVAIGTDGLALYRWTAESGAVKLSPPAEWLGTGVYWLEIYPGSLSDDGRAIRGKLSTQSGSSGILTRAFQWRQPDGFVSLEPLPGHALSRPWAQAPHGSVVAGASALSGQLRAPTDAVLWDCKGTRDIGRELTEAGVDLKAAHLSSASYVWAGASLQVAGDASVGGVSAAWIAWLPKRCE